jgi:hypothetical protein
VVDIQELGVTDRCNLLLGVRETPGGVSQVELLLLSVLGAAIEGQHQSLSEWTPVTRCKGTCGSGGALEVPAVD